MNPIIIVAIIFASILAYFALGCLSYFYLYDRGVGVVIRTRFGKKRENTSATEFFSLFWPIVMPFVLTHRTTKYIYNNASLKGLVGREEEGENLEEYKSDLKDFEKRLDKKIEILEDSENVALEDEELKEEIERLEVS